MRWLPKGWGKWGRIRRMEVQSKIDSKIGELNLESANGDAASVQPVWQYYTGYHALTKFDFNSGKPIFTPSSGVPVKAFLNTRTGEIRVFSANIFEDS